MKNEKDEYPFWRFWHRQNITREDGKPYLNRITILGIGPWFTIKYHNIVASDDACLHDHPWPFMSIILKGGYWEWAYADKDTRKVGKRRERIRTAPDGKTVRGIFYPPGSILFRKADWIHALELTPEVTSDSSGEPYYTGEVTCNTLIFTGKVCRKWGFWTKTGFKYWRNYSKQRDC